MTPSSSPQPFNSKQKYRDRFRRRVFRLTHEGYSRLKNRDKDYTESIEEEISHDLTEEIENFLEDDHVPGWVEKFDVHRERPISPHGETGIRRPRLDIRIRSGERPYCPTFVFEAKRLRQETESRDYFGEDGMQSFWDETGYPVNVFYEAGMLGYVQNGNCDHWVKWLQKHFENWKTRLSIAKQCKWERDIQTKELPYSYRTKHHLDDQDEVISIFHVLLEFR